MSYSELALPQAGATVAVGLSGGVDSCVTAVLLKERGCNVFGVTMSHWTGSAAQTPAKHHSCYGPDEAQDIEECRAFCKDLGIDYVVIDVRDAYQKEVLDYFTGEYRAGRTPNPCVRCNRMIKFGALLEGLSARDIAYDYFCTGHYASVVRPDGSVADLYADTSAGNASAHNSPQAAADAARPVMIKQAHDEVKDQSYFLYRVPALTLEKTRFPLSGMTKAQVKNIAREKRLLCATRSESQDFVPAEYAETLFNGKFSPAGDFVDMDGKVLGKHRGIERYTVGQRRGLGVSAKTPLYVQSIHKDENQVVLAREENLYCASLTADNAVWAGNYVPPDSFTGGVKIRLGAQPARAVITPLEGNKMNITFDVPQRAVAPGQSAVIYIDGIVAGGGIINEGIYE